MLNTPTAPLSARPRSEFSELLPALTRSLNYFLRKQRPEAREEAVAEGTAFALTIWMSAKKRRRRVTPQSLARFSAQLARAGRKSTGSSWTDCLSDAGRIMKKVPAVVSIDRAAERHLGEILEDRRERWSIVDRVAIKLDWLAFVATLPRRTQQVIDLLSEGYRRKEAARILGVTPPAVTMRMEDAFVRWQQFYGTGLAS